MFGSRQVSIDVCHSQTQAYQGQNHSLRQRCRSKLPPQAILGTIFHKELRSQLRTSIELEVICHEVYVTSLIENYRYHTVQEFNKGVYDYIIATDESGAHEEDEFLEAVDDTIEECR